MMTDEELIQKLEDLTKNAQHHQLETLRSILLLNGTVRYLQPFHKSPLHLDPSTFTRVVPLSSYEDYVHYINHMAEGKLDPFLSVDPLLCFFYSSGTSSSTMKPKLIPYFDSSLSKAASFIGHRGSVAVRQRLFPPRPEVNKILLFLYADNITTTKCGLKVMAASTYPLQSAKATHQQLGAFSSPLEVILGSHVEDQMYCHLLCGLRNLDVIDGITTPYAIGLIKAFGLLESNWEKLCDDLELDFHPELANRIRLICEGNNWGGIVYRLWPNTRYIRCVTTGSMKQYYQKLKYYAGKVPIIGGDYFASECCVGLNLDIMQPPETTRFVMLPTFAYFEFLPFNMNNDNDVSRETVDLSSVEVGKMYEVVVTTYRGFYRYRLGDIVRVVGFYNSSPLIEYVMRAPKTPSEIVTEKDLISAVENFQLALTGATRIEIVEFASFLDQESMPKQLKVFLEVQEESNFLEDKLDELVKIFRNFISSLESCLGAIYKVQKDKGQLGSLLIFVIRPGAFNQLSELAIKNGTSASQYKPPKIIRNHEVVKLLEKLAYTIVSSDG
ncbi:hypothetical protein VNO78_17279 [Psophocarpus tetragonolobus]|uniref:Indole-3-acetic acid-amido synthetase GH3.6 n=1 Tax=Psophocarpus tetragonolobus TaxID=3891 RepID=A0AAN9SH69_PSOTE